MPSQNDRQTSRLSAIEGLRGYLAIWVLLTHVVQTTGFTQKQIWGRFAGLDAVQCFMMVSGFVIFYLLDTKQEPYLKFLTRRFFRIFPVYFLIFTLSIPCLFLSQKLFAQANVVQFFYVQGVHLPFHNFEELWRGIYWHIPLHALMLHGLVPDHWLNGSATAFLAPAWSLSLEWQFYLIAPLWYRLTMSRSLAKQALMYVGCLIMLIGSKRCIPPISMSAALPLQIEFFYCGFVSYLLYRAFKKAEISADKIFPIVFFLVLAIYKLSDKSSVGLALLLWVLVVALLLEPAASLSSRYCALIFTNPVSVWLGKISFSVYISHSLVLIISKWALIHFFSGITPVQHLIALFALTLGFTIGLSMLLYYCVELPFINLGKYLTRGDAKASVSEHAVLRQ